MTPENGHTDDELGRLLTRAAQRRADHLHAAPLAFDDVRGTAVSIRRRRRVASGLAVAAAVAVIVPTAMFATRGTESGGVSPATQVPTVSTPSATPSPGPTDAPFDLPGIPEGPAPGVTVVDNGDLALARTGEATVRWTPDGIVVEAGGRSFGPYAASQAPAVNASGTAAAWATDEGDVMVWADGSEEPFVLAHPGLVSLRVAAVTGADCTHGKAGDCRYYVSGWDEATDGPASVTISSDGAIDDVHGVVEVNDATDDGRVLGYTEVGEGTSCSAVLDPDGKQVFSTCDFTLDAFSPTGQYVLASDAYHSGDGNGVIGIFTSDGTLLTSFVKKSEKLATWTEAVWEDDTHVLFVARQGAEWSVVRMDVSGSMEYAVPPASADDPYAGPPFRLETR